MLKNIDLEEIRQVREFTNSLSDVEWERLMDEVGERIHFTGVFKGVIIGLLIPPTVHVSRKIGKKLFNKGVERYFQDKEIELNEIGDTGDFDVVLKNKEEE